jgi:hypothetical protein
MKVSVMQRSFMKAVWCGNTRRGRKSRRRSAKCFVIIFGIVDSMLIGWKSSILVAPFFFFFFLK